jgi:alpha-glucosidase
MMLGAFSPFYRNHNSDTSIPQEAYRFPLVAEAARNAISMRYIPYILRLAYSSELCIYRYRLLDYFYTAFHKASIDGTPVLNPLRYLYPSDPSTWSIDLQFFFGDAILVSPVTQDNATSVDIYLPKDIFYDFNTLVPVQGQGQNVSLTNVNFTTIPVHIRSGVILPLRIESAMTTAQLRTKDFDIVVAPGSNGTASGSLYLDDGVSLVQKEVSEIAFTFSSSKLTVNRQFGFKTDVQFSQVTFLNRPKASAVTVDGRQLAANDVSYDPGRKVLTARVGVPISRAFTVELK